MNTRKKSRYFERTPIWPRIRTCFSDTFRTVLSPLTLFIWLASVVMATIAAPFETSSIMPWTLRALYWLIVVSLSVVVGYGARAVSLTVVGKASPILLDAMMVVLMTIVFSPIVWLITEAALPTLAERPPNLARFAGYVMMCTLVVVIGRRMAPGFEDQGYTFLPDPMPAPVERGDSTEDPRLLRRLAPEVRGNVYRLTANDHFVEIATENGAESLRMRLVDAIGEMEPVEGYCVHRSHWVAHEAIVRVERENAHKIFVILANNDRIPVSRKYRRNVEKAGWI